MADLRPGDAVETAIERVVPGGDGLARVRGAVALVAGALSGDRVRLRVEASPRLVRGAPGPRGGAARRLSGTSVRSLGAALAGVATGRPRGRRAIAR